MFGFYSFAEAAINEQPVYIYNESASDLISSLSDSTQNISSISASFSDTIVLFDFVQNTSGLSASSLDAIVLSDSVQNISSISVSFSDTMVLSDIGIVYRYGDWEVIQTPTSVWTPVSVGVSNVWTSIPSAS